MRKLFLIGIASLMVPALAWSKTIHVPSQYPAIQAAIDAAVNGDTVLVAPGTYHENITFKGKAITVLSSEGPGATCIDGGKINSVAAFIDSEGPDSVLEGFTLTGGWGKKVGSPPSGTRYGGGVYCESASPTIRVNIITDNDADRGGGIGCRASSNPRMIDNIIRNHSITHGAAIFCEDSSCLIERNTIHANGAQGRGGGIYCKDCHSVEIRDNVITENTAYDIGAGIYCNFASSVIISGNRISGNHSGSDGSGILLNGCSSILTNNIIAGNESGNWGGGVFCLGNCKTIITNNTFSKNRAAVQGGAFCCWHQCETLVANTVLWDNDAPSGKEIWLGNSGPHISRLDIRHSLVHGGKQSVYVASGCTLTWGAGMIDSDPLFVEPAEGDFHLTFNSPCRASGDDTAPGLSDHDFEGDPRIAHGTVDMGADEFYTHLYWTGDATPNGNVELKFVGLPGTTPVGLCIGTGVLDPPIPSMWGDWYLQFPIIGPIGMPSIPAEGVLVIPGTIPASPPAPYSISMQALIGTELTNLCLIEVE